METPVSTKRPLEQEDLVQEKGRTPKKPRLELFYLLVNEDGLTIHIEAKPGYLLQDHARERFSLENARWEDDRNNGTARLCVFYSEKDLEERFKPNSEPSILSDFLDQVGVHLYLGTPKEVLIGRFDGRPFDLKQLQALEAVVDWAIEVDRLNQEWAKIEEEGPSDAEEPDFPDPPNFDDISECHEGEDDEEEQR